MIGAVVAIFFSPPTFPFRQKKQDYVREYRERREVVPRKKRVAVESSVFRESNLTWRDHEERGMAGPGGGAKKSDCVLPVALPITSFSR